MEYSIVNGNFLSISCNRKLLYYSSQPVGEALSTILNQQIQEVDCIKGIYLCCGPGSLVAARALIAYFLGLNVFNSFEIYYVDILRDILLKDRENTYGVLAITGKKFIIAHKKQGEYNYKFTNLDELIKFLQQNPEEKVIWDQSIENLSMEDRGILSNYYDKVFYWNSNDLFIKNTIPNNMNSIVNYSLW